MARGRFWLLFFCLSGLVLVQPVIYGLKGQHVQMDPVITKSPDGILWKHNGNKVVEFGGTEEQVFGAYEGRASVDRNTARLLISDLRLEDSGEYELEVFARGKWRQTSYELEVIEKVAKPTITCQVNTSSTSAVSAVLLCSAEFNPNQRLLTFEWAFLGSIHPGNELAIHLGGELDERRYTCQVSNPVNHEASTFTAKECRKGPDVSAGRTAVFVVIVGVWLTLGLYCVIRVFTF